MVTRRGFSLLEVIVALTLLSIAMLAVASSGLLAARLLSQAEAAEMTAVRAQSVLDSLVINNVRGSGRLVADGYRIEWTAGDTRVSVRAFHPNVPPFEVQAAR